MFELFCKHNPADRKEIAELKATVKSLQNKLEILRRNNEDLSGQVERLRQAEARRIGMTGTMATNLQRYTVSPLRMDKHLSHREPSLVRSSFYANEARRHECHEYHDHDAVPSALIVPLVDAAISHDDLSRHESCSSHTDREESSYTEPDTSGSSDDGSEY